MPRRDARTIVILGPTGSGKTGVAIQVAKALDGEIISADSRAIYQGMDIGTAKPTKNEMQGIPHYGLDLVKPGERFTVADWKKYAEQKIKEIKDKIDNNLEKLKKAEKEFEENKYSQFDSKMAEIMIKIIDEDTDYLLHE